MNFGNQWLIDDDVDDLSELTQYPIAAKPTNRAKRWARKIVREVVQTSILVIVMYVGLNIFVPRYVVEGHSMEPSFYTDERVIVSRLNYLLGSPERGDIVIFDRNADHTLIKRIIGLPGETVALQDGQVLIDGRPLDEDYVMDLCRYSCRDRTWELGDDQYFVLGDNRNNSMDSHNFGPINRDQIIGKVLARYWPPKELHFFVGDPDY